MAPNTFGQSCNLVLNIRFIEKHNGKVLDAIKVTCRPLSAATPPQQTLSDENGMVTFAALCDEAYTIHVESEEYDDPDVQLIPGKGAVSIIKLQHNHQSLHTVTVRGSATGQLLLPQETISSTQNNDQLGADISMQLAQMTGVNVISNGANIAKPVIHGLHSNRILMLNNGVRQEDQQWGTEHAPNMDIYNQTLTILKGAAGVRYGTDAIGGVVLSSPSPIRSESGWGGNIVVGSESNSRGGSVGGMLEHRFRKHPEFAFRLQSSAKAEGNYQLPGGYRVANSGLREWNYAGTFQYRGLHSVAEIYYSHFGNTTGIYRGTHTGNQSDLLNAIASDTPLISSGFSYNLGRPRQVVSHDLVKVKLDRETRKGTIDLVYAFQNNFRQEYDVIRVENGKAQLNLRLQTHTINLNWERKDARFLRGETGVEGLYQHNFFADGDRVFIPSYYAYAASAYAIERFEKVRWKIESGLRVDYRHFDMYNPQGATLQNVRYQFDYRNPSFTLATNYRAAKDLNLMLTLSSAWRAPQASELFSAGLHQGAARIELGNRNLQPEQALNASLNVNGQWRVWRIEAETYAQRINRFIYLSPGGQVLTIRGYYNVFNYLQTNAFLRGTDINISCKPDTHWRFELRASMLRARDLEQHDWLILMPADRLSSSVRYEGKVAKVPYFMCLNGQLVGRQTRLPANFVSIDFMPAPQAYFLLGAEIGTEVAFKQQHIFITASGTNLLNSSYRDYMDVFRYFLNRPGRNISLHLRIPFS
jgi:iron complex outermembrane receptor protein